MGIMIPNMFKSISIAIRAAMVAALFVGYAEARASKAMEFEVASIKLNTSGNGMVGIGPLPGGRLNVTNATLRMLIRFAYNIDDSEISGGPAWMDSDHYDIVAKGDGNPTTNDLRQMLQKLLADRFSLKVHHDSKDLPVYALVVRKGGPKLKESEMPAAVPAARGDGAPQRGVGGR